MHRYPRVPFTVTLHCYARIPFTVTHGYPSLLSEGTLHSYPRVPFTVIHWHPSLLSTGTLHCYPSLLSTGTFHCYPRVPFTVIQGYPSLSAHEGQLSAAPLEILHLTPSSAGSFQWILHRSHQGGVAGPPSGQIKTTFYTGLMSIVDGVIYTQRQNHHCFMVMTKVVMAPMNNVELDDGFIVIISISHRH